MKKLEIDQHGYLGLILIYWPFMDQNFLNLDFCFIIKNMHSMPYLFFKNIYERTFFKLQQCQYFDIIFN